MYYIVNHTQHIIAADNSLLDLLSVGSIDELYTKIALGDIKFVPSDEKVTISTAKSTESYQTQSHSLSGMLGNITLVQIHPPEEDQISVVDDELFDLTPEVKEVEEKVDDTISFDDEPFDLLSEVEEIIPEETVTEEVIEEEVFTEEIEDDTSPIVIDIASISQDIGISTDDYNNFLNEYIDTALTLEEDLGSTEEKKRSHAIGTLSHLSNVLHLPVVTTIIEQIENTSSHEQDKLIKSLYATLARLTTTEIETVEETSTVEKVISQESFGTIDLSDVQPIHFDFQMEAAANDLSLPVELIEEFVNDFLVQAREETDKMLEAYEKGDLDTIQKIGHLLKGTASNLRINPLSDTLYEIQFCEDSDNLEKLIKEYWGHFLSFETQINFSTK